MPVEWTVDGKGLYVIKAARRQPSHETEVVIHDVATGAEKPWRVLVPPDPVGVTRRWIRALAVTPDGRSYAYHYIRQTPDLWVVEGLR
jgi:glucose/arabinose dehydrogenase